MSGGVGGPIRTHETIDRSLCGEPLEVAAGRARVRLETLPVMAADAAGLVHGGFVFGLADHAAMLAVNEPTVVLAAAELRFLAPVRVGESLEAVASVGEAEGRMLPVEVTVRRGETEILSGRLTCVVPRRHVLETG